MDATSFITWLDLRRLYTGPPLLFLLDIFCLYCCSRIRLPRWRYGLCLIWSRLTHLCGSLSHIRFISFFDLGFTSLFVLLFQLDLECLMMSNNLSLGLQVPRAQGQPCSRPPTSYPSEMLFRSPFPPKWPKLTISATSDEGENYLSNE